MNNHRRRHILNRIEELNRKYGKTADEPMLPWLDHYPETPAEWAAIPGHAAAKPSPPPPPAATDRRLKGGEFKLE